MKGLGTGREEDREGGVKIPGTTQKRSSALQRIRPGCSSDSRCLAAPGSLLSPLPEPLTGECVELGIHCVETSTFHFHSGWLQGYFLLREREPSLLRAPPYHLGVLVPLPPPPSSLAPGPNQRSCSAHSRANSFFPGPRGLRGGVTDSAGSCFWKILPFTLHLPCPSSPHRRQGWGGLLAIYYLPLLEEEDRPAPGLPGGGPGLGRRSSPLISHKYLLRVSCVPRTAGPERRAEKWCHRNGGHRHPHQTRNGG